MQFRLPVIVLLIILIVPKSDAVDLKYLKAVEDLLSRVPLIDGHNDIAHTFYKLMKNQINDLNITDLTNVLPWSKSNMSHTDIERLRAGKVGAQFWVAYVDCDTQFKNAVMRTWEQIDVIHRMINANPSVFEFVTSAQGIEDAFRRGKIGSLIGVEGGHSIDSSLANLRMMYDLGARYLTLTHGCPTPWADNSQLDDPGNKPVHNGLTSFGEVVIKEMNRLGMMVDISHVSRKTMRDALRISKAPIIFSHSSAYAICNHTRNVPDDILELVAENKGIVMVNFWANVISCNRSKANLHDVIDHIDHIRKVAGVDHVGIGGDYNGIQVTPEGLEDVSTYPKLFAEMMDHHGWTESDIEKLVGLNLLRVFRAVEKVRDEMATAGVKPFEQLIPPEDVPVIDTKIPPCNRGEHFKGQQYLWLLLAMIGIFIQKCF